MIFICLRRRAAERRNSGSQQAKQVRRAYPLTEEDPNETLLEGKQNLKFVGGSDDEASIEEGDGEAEEEGEGEGSIVEDGSSRSEVSVDEE